MAMNMLFAGYGFVCNLISKTDKKREEEAAIKKSKEYERTIHERITQRNAATATARAEIERLEELREWQNTLNKSVEIPTYGEVKKELYYLLFTDMTCIVLEYMYENYAALNAYHKLSETDTVKMDEIDNVGKNLTLIGQETKHAGEIMEMHTAMVSLEKIYEKQLLNIQQMIADNEKKYARDMKNMAKKVKFTNYVPKRFTNLDEFIIDVYYILKYIQLDQFLCCRSCMISVNDNGLVICHLSAVYQQSLDDNATEKDVIRRINRSDDINFIKIELTFYKNQDENTIQTVGHKLKTIFGIMYHYRVEYEYGYECNRSIYRWITIKLHKPV